MELMTDMFANLLRSRRRSEVVVDGWRIAVRRRRVFGHAGELLARLLRLALPVPHAGVESRLEQQLVMGAALDDDAVVEDDDLVGADDGGEPMRDDERGAIVRDEFQRILDFALGVAVERGG